MRNFRILFLALLGMVSVTACGDEKKNEHDAMPMQNDTRMEGEQEVKNLDDGKKTADTEFKDETVAAAFQHYGHVKTALVNSNAEEARNGANMLAETLENAHQEGALEAAKLIGGTSDLNEQRTAFSDLSAAMESMLQGSLASGEVYKQFCPMAFQGKGGYWLSTSEEVRNPYYGDKMLKCGRVEDTIK